MTTQRYIYIIGSMDDFDGVEALKFAYFNEPERFAMLNASVFEFDAPTEDVGALLAPEVAALIGMGLAFENDWCMDHTFSYLMEA
jgi:hypothetical protein